MSKLEPLRTAVAVSPDNVPLLLLVGEGCLDQFLFAEARENFQRVLANEPANATAQLGLARAAYQEILAMHDLLERNHNEAKPDPAKQP